MGRIMSRRDKKRANLSPPSRSLNRKGGTASGGAGCGGPSIDPKLAERIPQVRGGLELKRERLQGSEEMA